MATIPILFQRDAKNPVEVNFPTNCSLNEFQNILKGIYFKAYWMYSFICHGRSFDVKDEKELDQLKALLIPKTTLFAYTRQKGGCGAIFVDVTKPESMKRIEFSESAPAWRVAMPGLCLEGKCTNGKCEASQQLVIANVGIRTFDFNVEQSDFSKCPLCQAFAKPVTCAFNRCLWKYRGIIANENENEVPVKVNSEWTNADHAYHRFDDRSSKTARWLQLIFEVQELK